MTKIMTKIMIKIMIKIMMGIDRDIRRIPHGGIVKSICHAVLFFRE